MYPAPQHPALAPALVDYDDLAPRYGIKWSKVHVKRLVRQGRFPKPITLGFGERGANASAWLSSSIDAWIAQRIAASCGAARGE